MFQYFDKDNNSELSEEELVGYFTSVFRCMQSFDGSSFEGRTAMSLARITATRALLDADKDKSGSLSFDEFTKIFLNEQEEVDQKLGVFQVVNALKKSGDASKLMQALQDVNGDIDRVTFRKLIRDQIGDEVNESCIDMLYVFFISLSHTHKNTHSHTLTHTNTNTDTQSVIETETEYSDSENSVEDLR